MILEKFSLKGKVAIVTGSAKGLGKGIALGLAEAGCKILLVDVIPPTETEREIAAIGGSARSIICDLREERSAVKITNGAVDAYGTIDILVNNAGIAGGSFLADLTTDVWRKMFGVHCDGTFFFTRAVIKSMQKGDRIITIGGMHGQVESISEDSVIIKVHSGATIKMARNSIAGKLSS